MNLWQTFGKFPSVEPVKHVQKLSSPVRVLLILFVSLLVPSGASPAFKGSSDESPHHFVDQQEQQAINIPTQVLPADKEYLAYLKQAKKVPWNSKYPGVILTGAAALTLTQLPLDRRKLKEMAQAIYDLGMMPQPEASKSSFGGNPPEFPKALRDAVEEYRDEARDIQRKLGIIPKSDFDPSIEKSSLIVIFSKKLQEQTGGWLSTGSTVNYRGPLLQIVNSAVTTDGPIAKKFREELSSFLSQAPGALEYVKRRRLAEQVKKSGGSFIQRNKHLPMSCFVDQVDKEKPLLSDRRDVQAEPHAAIDEENLWLSKRYKNSYFRKQIRNSDCIKSQNVDNGEDLNEVVDSQKSTRISEKRKFNYGEKSNDKDEGGDLESKPLKKIQLDIPKELNEADDHLESEISENSNLINHNQESNAPDLLEKLVDSDHLTNFHT